MFQTIIESLFRALQLILEGDPEVISVTLRSIHISGLATMLSCLWGLPASILIGLKSFPGKKILRGFFNAMIGVPTVALGLILYLLFSKTGPLGVFQLLYTPLGVSIGQAILITPILVSFASNALESVDVDLRDLAKTLGASEAQTNIAIMKEAIWGVVLAVTASFNRAFAELGIAMMIGGNIRNMTRVLTTSIALETARGDIAFSIALAIILMAVVFTITLLLNILRKG
ncbi:MAG: ABC transporter permease [Candidatus Bathyarchaeia archaeon]|nr:ABC transporter permease [Candidatus Bathyarchaeota archaeon]